MSATERNTHRLDTYPDLVFGRPGLWCHECGRVFTDLDDHEQMRAWPRDGAA